MITAVTLFVSCDKNDSSTESIQNNSILKTAGPGYEFVVTCGGTCTSGDECKLNKTTDGYFMQCNCDNCYLEVTFLGEQGIDSTLTDQDASNFIDSAIGSVDAFISDFESYMDEFHTGFSYVVLNYSFITHDGFIGVRYSYELPDGTVSTVTFITEGIDGPTYRIDCSGDCDVPSATCREQWVLTLPPSAECTCQGTCAMTVTEAEPGLGE